MGLDADASPFMLSRQTRQIVTHASVVACETQVLCDSNFRSGSKCMRVMNMVKSLCEKEAVVLMVCHDMELWTATSNGYGAWQRVR